MAPSHRQQQQLSPSARDETRADSDEALAARFQDGLLQAPYYSVGRLWDDYLPAYRFGLRSQRRHSGLHFDDVAQQLEREWPTARGQSRLGWVEARGAIEDAWTWSESGQAFDAAGQRAAASADEHD